jgi:hypothetical protein
MAAVEREAVQLDVIMIDLDHAGCAGAADDRLARAAHNDRLAVLAGAHAPHVLQVAAGRERDHVARLGRGKALLDAPPRRRGAAGGVVRAGRADMEGGGR